MSDKSRIEWSEELKKYGLVPHEGYTWSTDYALLTDLMREGAVFGEVLYVDQYPCEGEFFDAVRFTMRNLDDKITYVAGVRGHSYIESRDVEAFQATCRERKVRFLSPQTVVQQGVTVSFPLPADNEMTEAPYWLIIDPQQMMTPSVDEVASMITGPFFGRAEGEAHLEDRRYAFSKRACVYCHSGHASRVYREAWRKAWSKEQPQSYPHPDTCPECGGRRDLDQCDCQPEVPHA